jgi:hypothetical protein
MSCPRSSWPRRPLKPHIPPVRRHVSEMEHDSIFNAAFAYCRQRASILTVSSSPRSSSNGYPALIRVGSSPSQQHVTIQFNSIQIIPQNAGCRIPREVRKKCGSAPRRAALSTLVGCPAGPRGGNGARRLPTSTSTNWGPNLTSLLSSNVLSSEPRLSESEHGPLKHI